jgi:hypothetical protein
MSIVSKINGAARVAELRIEANEIATLCKQRPPVIVSRLSSSARSRRLLFLMLAAERQRNAQLVKELLR